MQPTPSSAPNQAFWARAGALLAPQADILTATAGAFSGALGFFFWPVDPACPGLLLLPLLAVLVGGVSLLPRLAVLRFPGVFLLLAALLWCLSFLSVSTLPVLPYAASLKHPRWVVGKVVSVTPKPNAPARALLRLAPARVYLGTSAPLYASASLGVPASRVMGLKPGQGVAVPVVLLPPEGPTRPGGPDFLFYRFTHPTHLTGYARGTPEPTALPASFPPPSAPSLVSRWRATLFEATRTRASGTIAALLMGSTQGIPLPVLAAYRNTGLSHLLAISGMQLTLVGLGVFFLVRWLLAWVPSIALRINTRLPAAVLGLAASGFYALLAGGGTSVLRALAMVGVVLLAVLLGQRAQALRAWGLAAIGVMIFQPTLSLSAGFHLSLAAVLGLLLYDAFRPRRPAWLAPPSWPVRIARGARTMAEATLVAGAATAPLLFVHFQQITPLGMLANLVAIPLMLCATYLGFLALVLWPAGLAFLPLAPMAFLASLTTRWALFLAPFNPVPTVPPTGWAWWGALGLLCTASLFILAGIAIRRPRLWVSGIGLTLLLAWGLTVLAPPRLILWNGGLTGWGLSPTEAPPHRAYHLLWSDAPAHALQTAHKTGLPVVSPTAPVPTQPDALSQPPAEEGSYAWATRRHGTWFIQPLSCGRVWQRADSRCPMP